MKPVITAFKGTFYSVYHWRSSVEKCILHRRRRSITTVHLTHSPHTPNELKNIRVNIGPLGYLQWAFILNWMGRHCPLRTYHCVFFKCRKPSEDIKRRLFFMNMKGLNISKFSSGAAFTTLFCPHYRLILDSR